MSIRFALSLCLLLSASPAYAWNALGHKVIAAIAWQQLDKPTRAYIVATLRRHPRFDDDFAKLRPAGVTDDSEWTFQHAATWPDIARGLKGDDRRAYNHETWHYINFPLFHGGERPLFNINFETDYPPLVEQSKWNVSQAIKHCQEALTSDATPSDKALAYCWLFHLVGDIHQPLHTTALFSERFPTGDRGGNSIKTVQSENLHSFWDGLLGSSHKPNDVKREVAELTNRLRIRVDTSGGADAWIREGHALAKSFVYSPAILEATAQPGELAKVQLPPEYLTTAGEHARQQVVKAGIRLGAVIKALPISPADAKRLTGWPKPAAIEAPATVVAPEPPAASSGESKALTHWLNLNGNVRHNSTCRNFKTTKRGRMCTATEGKPCGLCGG